MKNKTTRLHFTEEELENQSVSHAAKKAKLAADKADFAKARLPTEKKLKHKSNERRAGKTTRREKTKSESGAKSVSSRLRFDSSAVNVTAPGSRTRHIVSRSVAEIAANGVHHEISKDEEDNVGVQAAHQSEGFTEKSVQTILDTKYSHRMKQYQKAVSLERKADRANVEALYQQAVVDNPEMASNPLSRWKQRQEIKKQYYAAKAVHGTAAGSSSAGSAAKGTEKTARGTKNLLERVREFAVQHSHVLLIILVIALLFLMISGTFSSCSSTFQGGAGAILGTSFTATDEDIDGTNEDYKALEAALQKQLDNLESTHSGYDEYRYQLDEINHNPYELTAYLTVVFEAYAREEVQDTLQSLFNRQYTLILEEETEIRTRTETRTDKSTDPETGETIRETYEVEVEYDYYILNVTLKNNGLGNVIKASDMTEEQQERYDILLQTLGNRSYLFEDDIYAGSTGPYTDYDIPGEALTNEKFANMIQEAEKYLGMPYVWGGSSPSTSFDCSGFVCWVINHCGNGWNVGRTTANGLMSYCDIIPASEAQPGDLIFFQGTYDTTGASHVGIYVGNQMMIHCGNPISYASTDTTYWKSHYYCHGRIR